MSTDVRRSHAYYLLEQNEQLREAVSTSSLFETLRAGLKAVEIDGETLFVAEGDTLLDLDQLSIYALQRERVQEARMASQAADFAGLGTAALAEPQPSSLVGIIQNGKIVKWEAGTILSYRVVRNTFPSESRYQQVRSAMEQATTDWENTCGVKFEHLPDLDGASGVGPAGALFAVRGIDSGGAFIAAAFFPNDPIDRRRVLVDPSFFDANLLFDPVGVLRHELGHVLGFRHEHIRSNAPAVCPDEPGFDTVDLTQYDPQSVMHYFCGGVGSRELRISHVDRMGAQRVYGPPLHLVDNVAA